MMDMNSTSEADNNDQNPQNPTTSPSPPPPSSSSSLPVVVGGENRHEPRPLHERGVGLGGTYPGFIGKHRMQAAIAYLDQQIQIIQEELDQLETLGESSIVCQELVTSIESVPDALLPETRGPLEIGWDRWFQGGHGSRNRKRWI